MDSFHLHENPQGRGAADKRRDPEAFSLVEVTLALGLVVFALVALMGLMSSGLQVSRQAKTELEASQVASALISLRRAVPTEALTNCPIPSLASSSGGLKHAYLDRSGQETSLANAYYDFSYTVEPFGDRVARLYFALSHPPQQTASGYSAIFKAEGGFEIITYVRLP
jgi:type II secretory pathway pseudopilin PulG